MIGFGHAAPRHALKRNTKMRFRLGEKQRVEEEMMIKKQDKLVDGFVQIEI